MTIAALVVDDEPIARHAIVRLLRDDPEVQLTYYRPESRSDGGIRYLGAHALVCGTAC